MNISYTTFNDIIEAIDNGKATMLLLDSDSWKDEIIQYTDTAEFNQLRQALAKNPAKRILNYQEMCRLRVNSDPPQIYRTPSNHSPVEFFLLFLLSKNIQSCALSYIS